MEKELTIAQKVLYKIRFIPKDKFIVGEYINKEETQCCLVGHLNRLDSKDKKYKLLNCLKINSDLTKTIIDASSKFNLKTYKLSVSIVSINDGCVLRENYPQDNPKDRVVALLKDMIKAGY